jgi:hypothetical protein
LKQSKKTKTKNFYLIFSLIIVPVILLIISIDKTYATIERDNADASSYTYFDPEGKFELEYPSNWEILPSTNDFFKVTIGQPNPSPSDFAFLSIGIIENVPLTATTEDLVDSLIQDRQQKMPTSYNVVKGPSCDTYTLSGQKACHFIEKGEAISSFNSESSALQIMSIINGDAYMFVYATDKPLSTFSASNDLLQAEQIKSFF